MGFKKVYKSLQEIFPQVDSRALRAVAIEHSKDADAAVQAVLEEIIPFFTERSRPSSPLRRNISIYQLPKEPIAATQNVDCLPVNPIYSAEGIYVNNVKDENCQHFYDSNDGNSDPFCDTNSGQHEGEGSTTKLTSENCVQDSIKVSADVHSYGEPVILTDETGINKLQNEVYMAPEEKETISADKCSESGIKTLSDKAPYCTLGTLEDVDMGTTSALVTVQDITMRHSESCGELAVLPNMHGSSFENLKVSSPTDAASKSGTTNDPVGVEKEFSTNDSVGVEKEFSTNDSVSQSGQSHIMNVLEEIIADARNNKKTLFSAMESVISMMREVELKEQLVEQSKEEVSREGDDVLDKVEELKQMMLRAKEANDMHAGEVYGEKAILATELRELQSRVLLLSDERDKSLAVLDEMHQTLEVRLAAAENEIKSAEQEKLEKQKSALKALADQEKNMEKVVQESNILKQQAEENAKLREFLVDRGCVVDTLQGEIAVICQDVKLLKEKFDDRVPLSKSLSSSQTSCILASSSSSLKSLIPDQVEVVPDQDDSCVTQHKKDPTTQVFVEEALKRDHEALLEEGWDIFEKFEIDQ